MFLDIIILIVASVLVYFAGEKFAGASSRIGDHFGLSKAVKGATLDAISSSFPELMVAVFSVIAFKKFEVGIGTVAGSALFNLLIIPALCVFVAPVKFKVAKEVIHRDGMFYNISVFVLLALLMYVSVWSLWVPFVLLAVYGWYLYYIIKHTNNHKKKNNSIAKRTNFSKQLLIALISMVVIALCSFFMTESAIDIAEVIGIAPMIVGFTIVAIATSLPDAIISIINAKNGDVDDAASNVFGSNIFDILIGLSIPVLLAIMMSGPVKIAFTQIEIIIGLLGATILVLFFFAENQTISKKQAWFMIFMFFVFQAYVILLSIA